MPVGCPPMSAQFRVVSFVATCLALCSSLAQADGLGLERRSWADPELSSLRMRVSSLPGGGLSVTARAADGQAAERARRWLASEPEVERFQVGVDPRLRRGEITTDPAIAFEDAVAAVRADAGTRPHLKLLGSAFLDERRVLNIETAERLDPAAERRLARLLLAQPGISGVWLGESPPSERRLGWRERAPADPEEGPTDSARRTRIHLDPLQPEAASIAEQESSPRTLLHVGPLEPAAANQDDAAASRASVQGAEQAERTLPSEAEPGPDASRKPESTRIDRVIEDLLARAMTLEGAPTTLKARVRSGVVVFGGQVASRELAENLRELARNFDGVRRVTGGLLVVGTGQTVPMDALPD